MHPFGVNEQYTSLCIKYYKICVTYPPFYKVLLSTIPISNIIIIEDKYQVEYDTIDDNTRHHARTKNLHIGLFCYTGWLNHKKPSKQPHLILYLVVYKWAASRNIKIFLKREIEVQWRSSVFHACCSFIVLVKKFFNVFYFAVPPMIL
jgi:hypothetical protein